MQKAFAGLLASSALTFGLGLVVAAGFHRTRDVPLRCSIAALPSKASDAAVSKLCGLPYTSNVSFEGGHKIEQWVYDAGTFLWFRDGYLAFEKIDERHVPEQAKMTHVRAPLHMCE